MIRALLLVVLSAQGCTEPEAPTAAELRPEPPPTHPSASEGAPLEAPPPPGPATGAAPDPEAPPAVEPDEPDEPQVGRAGSRWLGRWEAATRDGVCLELRANGRFELTSRGRGRGDVVVRGRYTFGTDGVLGTTVALEPRNIHQERYVTACRRHVFPEQDLPSFRILGVDVRRGRELVLTLREREDGTPELCAGRRCQPLRRRT